MFTVKIIDTIKNSERIFEAESVTREDGIIIISFNDDDAELFNVDGDGNQLPPASELTKFVYVMNRFGATVATYRL